MKRTSRGYAVDASFPFDVREHGIAIPSYVGVTIHPEMVGKISVELADAP